MKICPVVAELSHAERERERQRQTHKEDDSHFFAIFQLCLTNPLVTKWTTLWVNMSENRNSVMVLTESSIHLIIKVCGSADTRSQIDRYGLYIIFSFRFCKECDSPGSIPDTGKLSVRLNADMVSSTCTTE